MSIKLLQPKVSSKAGISLEQLRAMSKANEARIASIKQIVSRPFDNIHSPEPLQNQIRANR